MIIVSVLPISLLAFLLNRISENSIRKSVSSGFQNISQRAAKETHIFISGTENIIKSTSEIISIAYSDEWESKLILRNLVQNLDGFKSISFVSKDGQNIVSSNIEINDYNYSKLNFFKNAIKGNTSYSEIYISDTLMPTMKIGVPVKKLNDIKGILVAEVTVRYLWELIDNIKIGKTGHAYIVNKDGIVIAHSQRERVIKHEKFQSIPLVEKLIKGVNSTAEYVDIDGASVLGSGTFIKDLGLGVVVEQSIDEAFALVTQIHYITIILVAIATLAAIIIGFYRASKIVAPIKQLTEGARKVAQGNLTYKIDVNTTDEIGELADNFNNMTSSLKDAQEKLIENERLAILGRLSSIIAHEVRNPLEAIKGGAVYLRSKFTENEMIQKFTGIIALETDRLNSFVNQVLNSSKKIELVLMTTNINAILENTYRFLLRDSRFKKIGFTKDLDKNMPNCLLDPEKLQMAFLNIFVNSMEAMPKGGEIKVGTKYKTGSKANNLDESSIEQAKEHIEITVQDNGEGIPGEIKNDIFKPFVTTKKSGTGLGLAFSSEVIRQHRGIINLVSEQDQGTTVTIYLPIIQSKP